MPLEVTSLQDTRAHLRTLTFLSLLSRVLVAGLIVSSTYLLTSFDASPRLVLGDTTPPWISSLLRWDAFHFTLLAQKGYAYEHTWAFFPALPFLMRVSGDILSLLGLDPSADAAAAAPLLGGAVLVVLLDASSTRVLYLLSLHHLRSPCAAFLATALSLLSSSPATLRFASYTEPFFTFCAYRGMWASARARWVWAAVWFGLASTFRSNGIFLAGFILWGMLVEPCLLSIRTGRKDRNALSPCRTFYCLALASAPLVPFVLHNYSGYVRFCSDHHGPDPHRPEWCDRGIFPSIYGHVQARYWDVGFMRYWTLSNAPNFILALPILAVVYAFSAFYLPSAAADIDLRLLLVRGGSGQRARVRGGQGRGRGRGRDSLFLAPTLLPHVLHALALTLLLTFNAHVQIALRVLPSHPVVYWAAAWLLVERPWWGKAWIIWSVVWGAVSCVLWAVFLPPA